MSVNTKWVHRHEQINTELQVIISHCSLKVKVICQQLHAETKCEIVSISLLYIYAELEKGNYKLQ